MVTSKTAITTATLCRIGTAPTSGKLRSADRDLKGRARPFAFRQQPTNSPAGRLDTREGRGWCESPQWGARGETGGDGVRLENRITALFQSFDNSAPDLPTNCPAKPREISE